MKEKELKNQSTFYKHSDWGYYCDPSFEFALRINSHGNVILAEHCEVEGLKDDIGQPKNLAHLNKMYQLLTGKDLWII